MARDWNSGRSLKGNRVTMQIKSAKDLIVCQRAYELAMDIFEASKNFPAEEKYSLTDQIRRSSRSVCTNVREAWAKRRYEAHFLSKLTDADGENGETETWLDFAHDCGYLPKGDHAAFVEKRREIGAMLGGMISDPSSFVLKPIADL
jgi:four helix bundle protein